MSHERAARLSTGQRRIVAGLVAIGAIIALAACGGETTAPAPGPVTFTLATVNGAPLPFLFGSGSGQFAVTADAYTLNTDGSYVEAGSEHSTSDTTTINGGETGTWAQAGTTIVFIPSGSAGGYPAFLSGDTLSFNDPGLLRIYVKR